ncbi:uncharacterized protein isoform X2 [Choristoneura fumiferana]|uniref:uncharacterized protein isoform X2 n=1 Tax=Choristoneura fumiferana TaxID=7141 RepID=UPI003D155A7C
MFAKHILLALLVAYSSNIASTHIVTSAHNDLTFVTCVNSLTNVVQTTLCPMYGQLGPSSMEQMFNPGSDPRALESRSWEFRNNMKRCCSRPCTIPELVAIC